MSRVGSIQVGDLSGLRRTRLARFSLAMEYITCTPWRAGLDDKEPLCQLWITN